MLWMKDKSTIIDISVEGWWIQWERHLNDGNSLQPSFVVRTSTAGFIYMSTHIMLLLLIRALSLWEQLWVDKHHFSGNTIILFPIFSDATGIFLSVFICTYTSSTHLTPTSLWSVVPRKCLLMCIKLFPGSRMTKDECEFFFLFQSSPIVGEKKKQR